MGRHQRRAIFLVALTLGFSGATPAEKINKCTDNSGKVIYQKESCDTQQVEEKKDIDPDRNTVKMELPPPSEAPNVAPDPAAAPSTVIRRRRGY